MMMKSINVFRFSIIISLIFLLFITFQFVKEFNDHQYVILQNEQSDIYIALNYNDIPTTTSTTTQNSESNINNSNEKMMKKIQQQAKRKNKRMKKILSKMISSSDRNSDEQIVQQQQQEPIMNQTTIIQNNNNDLKQFAIAYFIDGCNPDNPDETYRYIIYHILVNTYIMRQDGNNNSEVDVIVFIQLSYESIHYDGLPAYDIHLLEMMNIQYRYITKHSMESKQRTQYDQFRILNLIQYQRVLVFNNIHTLLYDNLDYLFHLSMNGILQQNFIIIGNNNKLTSDIHNYIFMLTPGNGKWNQILDIIINNEEMKEDDDTANRSHFETIWNNNSNNQFERLLYDWTIYYEKSISILINTTIHNYYYQNNSNKHDTSFILKEKTYEIDSLYPFIQQQKTIRKNKNQTLCSNLSSIIILSELESTFPCIYPYIDFIYLGESTTMLPWQQMPPSLLNDEYDINDISIIFSNITHYWFTILATINKKYTIGIDFTKWNITNSSSTTRKDNDDNNNNIVPFRYSNDIMNDDASPYIRRNISKFAYVYIIGGCQPHRPVYRSYFYNILISTYAQRKDNSTADVIVFIQMSYESLYDSLPIDDVNLLHLLNIQIHYIPKSQNENFYNTMLDKFRIFELTYYDRILFLDGDVMLKGSLDYLMDLSIRNILKKNIVFIGYTEPANGGTFIIHPEEGNYQRILQIIINKEKRGITLPYPHWDNVIGWGHRIDSIYDQYQILQGVKRNTFGHLWTFHGAFADQGLLYHWVKYEDQDVSIILRDTILNIGNKKSDNDNEHNNVSLHTETIDFSIFDNYTNNNNNRIGCLPSLMRRHVKPCIRPHIDFYHFTGIEKPWMMGPPDDYETYPMKSDIHYWYYMLKKISNEFNFTIKIMNATGRKHVAPLGMFPTYSQTLKNYKNTNP